MILLILNQSYVCICKVINKKVNKKTDKNGIWIKVRFL